jgi:sporulation protein YlmC with PRC-barrel domain
MSALAGVVLLSSAAFAQNTPPAPSSSGDMGQTVTNYYKQTVYDKSDNSVGKIDDVLIDKSGKIQNLIIGVGGFLGVGEKDVAVPFNAVAAAQKNGKWYLTMDANKDQLKSAPGLKYDSNGTTWVPSKS